MEEANPSEKDSSLAGYLLASFHFLFEGRKEVGFWEYFQFC